MASLFGKGSQVEAAQPFELVCECGQSHTGLRRQRSQRIVCRACGCALFVLPRNVYPPGRDEPEEQPSADGIPGADEVVAAEEIQIIEPPTVRKAAVAPARTPAAAAPSRSAARPVAVGDKIVAPQAPPRRFWKPFRQLFAVILVVGLGWGAWAWYAASLDRAATTLKTAFEAGQAALGRQDWVAVRDEFGAAAAAADRLGSRDEAAQTARQYHREAQAMTGLASESLFDMAADIETHAGDDVKLHEVFTAKYAERWLIVETTLRRTQVGETEHIVLDIPLVTSKGQDVEIHADFDVLDTLALADGQQVILAGQFQSCTRPEGSNRWIVTLNPQSGFLWCHSKTYEGAGFGYDEQAYPADAINATLKRQAGVMGVAP